MMFSFYKEFLQSQKSTTCTNQFQINNMLWILKYFLVGQSERANVQLFRYMGHCFPLYFSLFHPLNYWLDFFLLKAHTLHFSNKIIRMYFSPTMDHCFIIVLVWWKPFVSSASEWTCWHITTSDQALFEL